MAKIKRFSKTEGWKNGEGWAHYCPACKQTHGFATEIAFDNGSKWTFNGNMEAPTFAPSMNIRICLDRIGARADIRAVRGNDSLRGGPDRSNDQD